MARSEGAPRRGVVAAVFADDNRGIAALNHAAAEALREAMPGCSISMIAVTDPRANGGESYALTTSRDADVELLAPPIPVTPGRMGSLLALLQSLRLLFMRPGAGAPLAIQRVLEADLVVSRGGYHSFRDRRGLRGVVSMWLTLFPIVLATRFRVPTAVLPSAVGPFRHWPSRALSRWVLRRTTLIMVRDSRSQRQVLAMGVDPARVVRIPDGVFRSRRPTMAERRAVASRLGFGDVRFGAVTVRTMRVRSARSPQEIRRFYDSLAEVIRILLDRQVVEHIAVVLQVDGSAESDAVPSTKLVNAVNDPRVRLVPSGLSPDELIAFYGAAQFVITSHLHASIFSLVAGTPAFPFSLMGEKVDGVFEDLGLQRFVVTGRRFDPATLAETVAQTTANGETVRTEIRQAVDAAGAEAGRAAALLRAASNGDRRTSR